MREGSLRNEFVQPGPPETWYLWLRYCDTAEQGEDDDDERIEKDSDEGAWRPCGDCLSESDGEELGDQHVEEVQACSRGGWVEAGSVGNGQSLLHLPKVRETYM